jgi:hypothetical protein
MPKRRGGAGRSSGNGTDREPAWVKQLEKMPVGKIGAGVVVAGWAVLVLSSLYLTHWSLEVTFFLVVGWLTFVLGCLSLAVTIAEAQRKGPTKMFRLEAWKDVEEYVRWLTPMAFVFGLIFAHYYWH